MLKQSRGSGSARPQPSAGLHRLNSSTSPATVLYPAAESVADSHNSTTVCSINRRNLQHPTPAADLISHSGSSSSIPPVADRLGAQSALRRQHSTVEDRSQTTKACSAGWGESPRRTHSPRQTQPGGTFTTANPLYRYHIIALQ